MIERRSQAAVVIIFDSHKAECLQHALGRLPHGAEDFGHAVHGACLRLERDFDKIALGE